jgi:putative ATP-dependent endonuclease of OLD family
MFGRRQHMLSNKADAAFGLRDKKGADLNALKYIQEAIEWIRA